MKEIKFRIWHKRAKVMEKVISLFGRKAGKIITVETVCSEKPYHEEEYPLKDIILMQYTGLKDKNNVEIYENDFYEYGVYSGKVLFDRYVSDSDEDIYGWIVLGKLRAYPLFRGGKVIGNIYENPELIK